MGLRADILKPSYGECSNGGISSQAREVTIVNVEGPSEPNDYAPAVMLVHGNVPGSVKIIAAEHLSDDVYVERRPPGRVGPMMGGSYIATADSRLREACEAITGAMFDGAVPFHDRFETVEQYAAAGV